MALSQDEVLKKLQSHGISSLEDLAQKVAEQSEARVNFARAMEFPDGSETDYVWSGKNYSLYHPE